MKKLIYFISFILLSINSNISFSNLQNQLENSTSWWVVKIWWWSTTSSILSPLFVWLKTEVMMIVTILVIAAFIYIGIKMSTARWNPEEFKKAWLHLVYIIIWVFVIFMAWWAVKLVSNLTL